MDWRLIVYPVLLLLLLWAWPYVGVFFARGNLSEQTRLDVCLRERRLLRLCAFGALVVLVMLVWDWFW